MNRLSGEIKNTIPGQGRVEKRGAFLIPTAWIDEQIPWTPQHSGAWLSFDPNGEILKKALVTVTDPMLAIFSDAVPAIENAVARHLELGGRVYGIVADNSYTEKLPDWLAAANPTSILLRRLNDAPIAMLMLGKSAWIWFGTKGPGPWRLKLTEEQAEDARLVFLELFWNQSNDEGWPEAGKVIWRARGDTPFDIPRANSKATISLLSEPPNISSELPRLEFWYHPRGVLPNCGAKAIVIPPSGLNHDELRRRAIEGKSQIEWKNLEMPWHSIGKEVHFFPTSNNRSVRIIANSSQRGEVELLSKVPATATFLTQLRLQDIEKRLPKNGAIWLEGCSSPQPLIEPHTQDAGSIVASELREALSLEPTAWPNVPPLALSVNWTWTVRVPTAPQDLKDDPLIAAWGESEKAFKQKIHDCFDRLSRIDEIDSKSTSLFESLKSAFLGYRSRSRKLREDLSPLDSLTLKALPLIECRNYWNKLDSISEEILGILNNATEEVAKAEIEQERLKQLATHNETTRKARDRLQDQESKLKDVKLRLQNIEEQIHDAQNSSDITEKDRKVALSKLQDEKKSTEKEIRKIENQMDQSRREANASFDFKPTTSNNAGGKKGTSFVPAPSKSKSSSTLPMEELPKVGTLAQGGNKRLLIISDWKDLDLGEQEAIRLKARLVARRNA